MTIPSSRRSGGWLLAFTVLAAGAAGCFGESLPTAAVSGQVTYRGQPLPKGTITFLPLDGSRPGSGRIENGEILDVMTLNPGDGAPLGPCKVKIDALENPDDMYAPRRSLIPERYGNPDASGLTADIQSGGPPLKFDLTD